MPVTNSSSKSHLASVDMVASEMKTKIIRWFKNPIRGISRPVGKLDRLEQNDNGHEAGNYATEYD